MSRSFDKLATTTFNTFRTSINAVTGLSTDPAPILINEACTPLDPVDPELREMYGLAFTELLQCMVRGGLDVREGDTLSVAGSDVEYLIRAVGDWFWRPSGLETDRLILEEIK